MPSLIHEILHFRLWDLIQLWATRNELRSEEGQEVLQREEGLEGERVHAKIERQNEKENEEKVNGENVEEEVTQLQYQQ